MPPVKTKRCCVPHCPNTEGGDAKKQFFRMGANLAYRNKLRVGKLIHPNSAILHCCEDHFDLPNDALNYIRYKFQPGTKLKLRTDTIPHIRLPVNVCRLCLSLIYDEDDMVDIAEETREVVTTLLPTIDLSITLDPVACLKCYNPLKKSYEIKKNALNNEMVVVHCVKALMERSPKRFVTTCQIDLFDEYNDVKDLLKQSQEVTNDNSEQTQAEENREITIVEDQLAEVTESKDIAKEDNSLSDREDEFIIS